MMTKYKTALIMAVITFALACLLYYFGGKVIDFMVKMHGG